MPANYFHMDKLNVTMQVEGSVSRQLRTYLTVLPLVFFRALDAMLRPAGYRPNDAESSVGCDLKKPHEQKIRSLFSVFPIRVTSISTL